MSVLGGGHLPPPGNRHLLRLEEVEASYPVQVQADPSLPWVHRLIHALGLDWIADHSADEGDREDLLVLKSKVDNLELRDLTALAPVPGKVVLTNYHHAKGREFDVVVLPGLVEREVPMYWNRAPSPAEVAAARRELYVAMTRARHRLVLVSGDWYVDYKGHPVRSRPSRFLPGAQPA